MKVSTARGAPGIRTPVLLVLVLIACISGAYAEKRGDGSVRLEYQYIRTGNFVGDIGTLDIGWTDAHSLTLSLDYAISDKWSLTASLPFIKKRHRGNLPHNPQTDFTNYSPPDLRLIDDGNYHSDFQDLYVGARYRAKTDGRLTIEPHIAYGFPTNDYQVYAHAAVGRNRWHIPIGASFSYRPYFSDFYFDWDISYVFVEKTLGVDISHWLASASVGYFMTPSLVPNVFVLAKKGFKGLDSSFYGPQNFDSAEWFYHDRMIKHNFVSGGVGLNWIVNDRYVMSFSAFKMIDPDQVNEVDFSGTIGITRYFSREPF